MWQYSMRTMMFVIFAISIVLFAVRLMPAQVSTFVIGATPAPILTTIAIYRRQRSSTVITMLLLAWLVFYVVSVGPVAGGGMWLGLEKSQWFDMCFDGFYFPLILLYRHTSFAWPIEWYVDFWQHLGKHLR